MKDDIAEEWGYSTNEPRAVLRFLAHSGGWSFISIGGATVIGNMVDKLTHTGVLFGLTGATIGLGIALAYIYLSFRRINSR